MVLFTGECSRWPPDSVHEWTPVDFSTAANQQDHWDIRESCNYTNLLAGELFLATYMYQLIEVACICGLYPPHRWYSFLDWDYFGDQCEFLINEDH